ncbi:hypothetical protein EIO_0656 [Ketogulonicigenium vulgare Y25]|uniref:Uncharacterized protein n=1 Tax=Ketogulonicigenium vulgare (strain WSH-001) TaxID=759362 RepID=F9Y8Y9_KETVW|nr:hypothetical protein EIO_0656 [Ketogulonicigenium vulgare Y25]AEM40045.1 hypothetical protein KVU_0206 [Ketogulonicigenium vulgare WSH-001]ALJ80251.1 hypothetical protein KVH_03105 [Ketogulonicigenium vulgare]ANW34899.1 hypothetical protein KvSKV_03100 [Ketogulonicigenium vulgare]AOZ53745.1 hypothetical protein KVC_0721 [Ketogulonicigenium vulgare]
MPRAPSLRREVLITIARNVTAVPRFSLIMTPAKCSHAYSRIGATNWP